MSAAAETVQLDVAVDATPQRPPTVTVVGPTLSDHDLVGRKVVALFSRAAARDFMDVFELSHRFPRHRLVELAADTDAGFNLGVLADMIGFLRRIPDADLRSPRASVDELRGWFADWAAELRS